MFESAGGDIGAWFGNLFGGTPGTGWGTAPGMTEAGYGLAPGLSEGTSFGNSLNNAFSKDNVTNALGSLGAASKGAQANKGAATAPVMPGAGPSAPSMHGNVSLDNLVAMLARRREALLASATGGVGAGRPQGLLGV